METTPYHDARGHFFRAFCKNDLASILGNRRIEQINVSHTNSVGTIRGMHFQCAPHAEMKLIRCLKGMVWDVAVDLRRNSNTFLKWYATELSPEAGNMLIIPEGCAHGFQVLKPESELLYLHTAGYSPEAEAGIRFDDPLVSIRWPLPAGNLSPRDLSFSFLPPNYTGIRI